MAARYSLVLDGTAIKELPVGDTLAGQAASGANADITALSGLTTALSVPQGGTGAASFTANTVLLGSGTSALQTVAPGTAGNVLTSNGTGWTSGAAPSSNGGATETSSAVDITLTAASTRVQAVAMTASTKSITLPSATTLTTGGALFVIKNTGTITFAVRNSVGTLLAPVAAGQIIGLYLSNNATAAGVWAVGNKSTMSFLEPVFAGAVLTVNSVASSYAGITALSATQAIVAYIGTSGYLQACTLNVSGTTITAGAVLTVNSVASGYACITALSATQAIVAYRGTSGYLQACTLNVSGTTITAGAVLTVSGLVIYYPSITTMSPTQALVTYAEANSNNYHQVRTLNVSGTTVTAGTALDLLSAGTGYSSVTALSATQAVLAYKYTNNVLYYCTINISGTTLTKGADATQQLVTTGAMFSTKMSATQVLVTFTLASGYLQTFVLKVSGTTVSLGSILSTDVQVNLPNINLAQVTTVSSIKALVVLRNSSGMLQAITFNVNGMAVSIGVKATIADFVDVDSNAVTMLSASQAVVTYAGTSLYLQTSLLEVTPS